MEKKSKLKTNLQQYGLLLLGCVMFSIYVSVFLSPNNIGTGGLVGISLILNKIFGFKMGISTLLMNIPLFIFGYKLLGKKFAAKSAFIVLVSSYLIDNIPKFITITPLGDKITAAIFCGVISGIGMAFIFMGGGSTGGLDISGKILKNIFKNIQLSKILLMQDLIIYLVLAVSLDFSYVIYALVLSYVRSRTIESVQNIFSASHQCIIVCNDSTLITKEIHDKLGRGATVWDVEGSYSHNKKKFVYVVIQSNEINELRALVDKCEKGAFVTITQVGNVVGNFKEHSLTV